MNISPDWITFGNFPPAFPATRRTFKTHSAGKSFFYWLAGGLLGAALPLAHAANWAWDSSPAATNFNSANWTSGSTPGTGTGTPATGDSLYFGASSQFSLNNDLNNYSFGALTFNASAGSYLITGNAITNSSGIANNSTSAQQINLNLFLSGNPTVTTTAGGGDLTLSGIISGPAYSLTVGSAPASGGGTQQGSTTLAGSTNNLAGVTIVNGNLTISGQTIVPAITIYQWNKAKNINAYLSVSNGGQLVFSSLAISVRNTGSHVTPLLTLDNGTLKTSAAATIGSGLGILINAGGVTVDTAGGSLASSSAFTHGTGSPDGGLILTGGNVLTLPGANNFSGNTVIKAGTLALTSGATLASTPQISLAGGATFDVSALAGGFTLGSSQTLAVFGTNASAVISGNFNSSSAPSLQFSLKPGVVPLQSTNGTLTLSANSTINVAVLNGGTGLTAGNYRLIAAATGGSVTGTAPAAVVVAGDGLAAGATGALQIVNNELYLAVSGGGSPKLLSNLNGRALNLNWASSGWKLQVQTNNLGSGLGTNWIDIAGSTTLTNYTVPVDAANEAVFFRLATP
jgi:autotransporter-associated beta strand protein